MHPFTESDIGVVKRVVEYLRQNPDELHRDEFSELFAYMKSFGADIPPPNTTGGGAGSYETHQGKSDAGANVVADECASEPDAERWVLEDVPDDDIPDDAGNEDCTPEDQEAAAELRSRAAECAADGKLPEAIDILTQAVRLVPTKALYWSYRAGYLLQSARPGAALRDANKALKINPDNVRALRVRGTISRHLGKWIEALSDLSKAQSIDYDEQVDSLLRLVKEKVAQIEKRQRQAEEAAKQKQRETFNRQREEERAQQRQQENFGSFPGGMPPGMEALFDDPEVREAMSDPEVAAKITGMMQNPASALQLLADPKVGPLMRKIMAKAMGGGNFGGGGFGGGMPGAGARPSGASEPKQPKYPSAHNSDDLD